MDTRNNRSPQIIEKGYRPTNKLDTSHPPKGGSAVPSTIPMPKQQVSPPPVQQSKQNK